MKETPERKPVRLTKKALLEYCDEQIAITRQPVEPAENAIELMEAEWQILNEKMKADGLNRTIRSRKRRALRVKYGLKPMPNRSYNTARLNFINGLKHTFGL